MPKHDRQPADRRTTFEPSKLAPEIFALGWDSLHNANERTLGEHTHTKHYEICLIVRGRVDWWVGRDVFEVQPGDLFITRPGEPHGGIDSLLHLCELYWLLVALPTSPRAAAGDVLPGIEPREARRIARDFARLAPRQFPAGPAIHELFFNLIVEHRNPGPHSGTLVRAMLHQLLVEVLRANAHAGAADAQQAGAAPKVRAAQQWMLQRLGEDYAVEEAATAVGLSTTQFHALFRRETGFTPGDWRNRERIRQARQLLRHTDLSVTRVAMRCGFTSSQYFATCFKKITGLTPSQYRPRK